MKRAFIVNILLVFAINGLIKPIYIFGIERTIQNTVDKGEYGLFFTLYSFTYLFHIISDLGIRQFNNRNIAQHTFLLDKYFPNLLVVKGLISLLYLLVVLIAGMIMGYTQQYPYFVTMITFSQILQSLVFFLRSNISGLGLYKLDSILSAIDRFLLILILAPLLYIPSLNQQFEISWFIHAQIFTLSITVVIAFLIIWKNLHTFKPRFNLPFIILLLKKSAPYAIAVFLMTAYTKVDAIMINQILGENGLFENDYYASAYRLFEASNMAGVLFAGLLIPMFAKLIKAKANFSQLLNYSFQMIIGGSLALVIATFLFRAEIMMSLYESGSQYSGDILGMLMISFLAVSGIYIYSALLTADNQMKAMNRVFILGLLLNLICNSLLIPEYKGYGAAIATAITQFFVFGGLVYLTQRYFRLGVEPRTVIRIIIMASASYFLGLFIKGWLDIAWLYKFVMVIGISIGIAFALRLLDLKSFLELTRNDTNPDA